MSALVDVKVQAAGKWPSVLNLLGIDSKYFNGKHQDCPICQAGKDRFRWNRSTEYGHCNHCGALSPVDMAIHWTGKPYKEAAGEIRKVLGVARVSTTPEYKSDDAEKNQARIERIKSGLKTINGECIASRYLAGRGLKVLPKKDCYFHPAIEYWSGTEKTIHPAMVSIFRNIEGKGSTFHITYLTPDGKKANVESPKKILPVVLPLSGCAIRLFNPAQGVLAIAEGVETALAVHQLEGLPVWASGNAGQMAALKIPDEVREVWIYGDNDANYVGQKAAYTLANRLINEGKKVFVEIAKEVGGDFLDILNQSATTIPS